MIQVSISRTSLGLPPLVMEDSGTGTYTIMPGFSTGPSDADNVIAESRWQNGGVLTSTRRNITQLVMNVRVIAAGVGMVSAVNTLAAAVEQFGYTVTVVEGGVSSTYTCLPANWRRLFDERAMLSGRDYVALVIPRQP